MTKKYLMNTHKAFLVYSSALVVLFSFIFYGADFIATKRNPKSIVFVLELGIPYVEWMFVIYFSVFLIPLVVYVKALNTDSIVLWAQKMSITMVVAGICFLIFPLENQFHKLNIERTEWVQSLVSGIAGKYNLFPSLHVALSVVTYLSFITKLKSRSGLVFGGWLILIVISTLLTHQHHIADVVSGLFLAVAVNRFVNVKARRKRCNQK